MGAGGCDGTVVEVTSIGSSGADTALWPAVCMMGTVRPAVACSEVIIMATLEVLLREAASTCELIASYTWKIVSMSGIGTSHCGELANDCWNESHGGRIY